MIGNNKFLWWIIIATGFVVCGCNHHTLRQLYDVEEYVDSKPDSALQVLSAMDTAEVADGKCRAMYAYLTSYAHYKSYIEEENDSTITSAVDYFREHNDKPRLMKALYFKGYTQWRMGAYHSAIVSLTEGEDLADSLGDDFFAGLCCREMALLFEETVSEQNSLENILKAQEHFIKSGHEEHALYAQLSAGNIYAENGQVEAAVSVYENLLETSKTKCDTLLMAQTSLLLAEMMIEKGDAEEALRLFSFVTDSLQYGLSAHSTAYLARAYAIKGNKTKSHNYFGLAAAIAQTAQEKYTVNYLRYLSALELSDNGTALSAIKQVLEYVTGKDFVSKRQVSVNSQRDYFRQVATISALENRLSRQKLYTAVWAYSLLAVLLLLLLTTTIRMYLRKKQEKECLLERIHSLSAEHSEHLKQSSKMGMSFFNAITQVYWQNQPEKVVLELKKILDGLGSDKYFFGQMIMNLNITRNNLMIRLGEQVPSLKTREMLLYCYLASHLEHNTICSILDKTPGAVNAQIYRLRKKIERSGAPDTPEFIEVIS